MFKNFVGGEGAFTPGKKKGSVHGTCMYMYIVYLCMHVHVHRVLVLVQILAVACCLSGTNQPIPFYVCKRWQDKGLLRSHRTYAVERSYRNLIASLYYTCYCLSPSNRLY